MFSGDATNTHHKPPCITAVARPITRRRARHPALAATYTLPHRMRAPAGCASPLFAVTSLNSMDSGHQEVMPISTPDLHARRLSSSNAWAAPLSRTDSCHLPLLSAERIYNTLNILYYTA